MTTVEFIFNQEWETFEPLLKRDLVKGSKDQFEYRLRVMRYSASTAGCTRKYLDAEIPKRVEQLQQKLNRGVIVYG